jgi:hypothetical protein
MTVFADTFMLIAWLNAQDDSHAMVAAKDRSRGNGGSAKNPLHLKVHSKPVADFRVNNWVHFQDRSGKLPCSVSRISSSTVHKTRSTSKLILSQSLICESASNT